MGAVTIDAFDGNGEPISLSGVDLSQGDVTISTIDKTLEWGLKLTDDTPQTNTYDHIGGTPDDR